MYVQTGKTFIATLIAVVLALGGLAWLSSDGRKSEPTALAQTGQSAQAPAPQPASGSESSANTNATPSPTNYEDARL